MLTIAGIPLTEIFEMCFLLCFAVAWPVNIAKSLRSRTAKGKSVAFEVIVAIGYLFGLAAKFTDDHLSYVVFFYVMNLALVSADIVLYFRNVRLDKLADLKPVVHHERDAAETTRSQS